MQQILLTFCFASLAFLSFLPIITICYYFRSKPLVAQRLVDGVYKDVALILLVSGILSYLGNWDIKFFMQKDFMSYLRKCGLKFPLLFLIINKPEQNFKKAN